VLLGPAPLIVSTWSFLPSMSSFLSGILWHFSNLPTTSAQSLTANCLYQLEILLSQETAHGGHHCRTRFGRMRLRPSSTLSSGFKKSMRQTMLIVSGVQSGHGGVLFRDWGERSQTWCIGDGKGRFFLIYCHFWAFILCAASWERMLFVSRTELTDQVTPGIMVGISSFLH
jgi:hypothetical protein